MGFQHTFWDQMGREVRLPQVPQRIISLCPSLTETLVRMGLGPRLVGRTRFCIHPMEDLRAVPQVGGTKDIAMERVRALAPDLIIGEKEENTSEMIAALAAEWPVYMTDVVDLASARDMILRLGAVTDLKEPATAIAHQVDASWRSVQPLPQPVPCLYFIWKNPWMVVGANTFIDSVLEKCGFVNAARAWEGRYPMLDEKKNWPEKGLVALVSTEPFPFKESHVAEIQSLVGAEMVRLVDGEMFSWYGARMIGVENYMKVLLQDVATGLSLHDYGII